MYIIIHETTSSALLNILKMDKLLKSSEILSNRLTVFQGNPVRRLTTDPTISLKDANFTDKFDEVDGVYFRLLTITTPIKTHYGGDCVLIFSRHILNDYNFVINTEENFGFCICKDGVVAEAQFSGEEGLTVTNLKNLHFLETITFNPYSSEIVVLDNVNLKYLRTIFIKSNHLDNALIKICHDKNIDLYVLEP